jgi:hypothetical protein
MSLDSELPQSLDVDPPAYSQPTLPPPPVAEVEGPGARPLWSARWGARVVGGGIAVVAALTVGAYAVLPHSGASAHAASASPAPLTTLSAHLDQLARAFPEAVAAGKPCSESNERIPLVLLSTIEGLAGGSSAPAAEAALFAGSLTEVTGPTMTTQARRVAILRTRDLTPPVASHGDPTPGRYEGDLVVFDASTSLPLCQTVIRTWSSYPVVQPKISTRTLNEDFVARVRGAVAEAAVRLHVALDL